MVPFKALPCETTSLTAAVQPFVEKLYDLVTKKSQGSTVVGHPIVVEVSSHLARYSSPDLRQLPHVAIVFQPLPYVSQ